MLFKIKNLLLMLSIFTLLQAQATEKPWINVEVINTMLALNSSDGGKKTWVGVYKVGTSTDWSNVETWTWMYHDKDQLDIKDLSAGKYEARLFYNNSYKMEAKATFTKEPSTARSFIKLDKKIGNSSIDISHSVGPKTWIGIYLKGSSIAWHNVKAWKWAKTAHTNISVASLTAGEYEARLFYNNSYKVEDKFTFTHQGGPAGGFSPIKKDITLYLPGGFVGGTLNFLTRLEFSTYGATTEKPWVGIFKKGAPLNKQNLITRGDLHQNNKISWITPEYTTDMGRGEYDMVYFPTENFISVGERKTLSIVAPKMQMEYNEFRSPNGFKLAINKTVYNKVKKDLDWVGIFKTNDEPTKENLIAWSYMKDGKKTPRGFIFPKLKAYDIYTYKIVLFSDNSYKILSIATIATDI